MVERNQGARRATALPTTASRTFFGLPDKSWREHARISSGRITA